ncbi:hypothetical protein BT69DRAFT_1296727 [Atractiella rhizophila]|nr:hypothetical protein BT69DRAFT_1296727 [Atractiella rhizophila]
MHSRQTSRSPGKRDKHGWTSAKTDGEADDSKMSAELNTDIEGYETCTHTRDNETKCVCRRLFKTAPLPNEESVAGASLSVGNMRINSSSIWSRISAGIEFHDNFEVRIPARQDLLFVRKGTTGPDSLNSAAK